MLTNLDLFARKVLECGYDDLRLLEQLDSDILDSALSYLQSEGKSMTLNAILEESHRTAIDIIQKELGDRFKDDDIHLGKRFSGYYNLLDTHPYLKSSRSELMKYEKSFDLVEKRFEELTGHGLTVTWEGI